MVVIRKGSKPDYTSPEAYRSITLLCTAWQGPRVSLHDTAQFIIEEHHLLPETHIGGRVSHSCDHTLHLLLYESWWQDNRVTSLITLDAAGAFDTVSHKRLVHCLQMHVRDRLTRRVKRLPSSVSDLKVVRSSNRKPHW